MHNQKVLNDKPNETGIKSCNCHNQDTCLLPNNSQTTCIIYPAKINCGMARCNQKCYLGSCKTSFECRFRNHKKLFNHVKHKHDTELLKEFL